MKNLIITVALILANVAHALPTYNDALDELDKVNKQVQKSFDSAPSVYDFKSRFKDNESSVSYTGQTLRLVLISSLKQYMNSKNSSTFQGSTEQANKALNSYFAYNSEISNPGTDMINGYSQHGVKAKDLNGENISILEDPIFISIYPNTPSKNLIEKIAGNDKNFIGPLRGWPSGDVAGIQLTGAKSDNNDKMIKPETLVTAFFNAWSTRATSGQSFVAPNGSLKADRIKKAYITEQGLDLTQLTDKFLSGAVAFSQIANDYLSINRKNIGLNVDNEIAAKEGAKNYTTLEHHWDEAFGYFGVARDFSEYSDADHKSGLSIDTNNDGKISILTEKSLGGFSKNASRFDSISQEICKASADINCKGLTLSEDIIDSFLKGRNLITERPKDYKRTLANLASVVIYNIEKTIAVTTLHYLNSTLTQMNNYGTDDYSFYNYSKFWSEMKGFALAFQFNPNSPLSIKSFDLLHLLIGDKPTLMSDSAKNIKDYKSNLLAARKILKETYNINELLAEKF